MDAVVQIGDRLVGDNQPVFIIAEIGINHNGDLNLAKKLIAGAIFAGCDAVKFQKRTPELCVPYEQWYVERDTPWGRLPYIEYKHKLEFDQAAYEEIDRYCRERGILWTASCWDEPSVQFIEQFAPPFYKAASASLTDRPLLCHIQATGKPLIISTGMSRWEEIETAVSQLNPHNLLIAHSTSAYPCPLPNINLRMIGTLKNRFPQIPIGYSGHEVGLAPTWAAVALGATFVERHLTLDRAMWGSDQAASVEVMGMHHLVRNIRDIEVALGDGVKQVYASEQSSLKKLRRPSTAVTFIPEVIEELVLVGD
jgi:N-acetylneuraminate synthase